MSVNLTVITGVDAQVLAAVPDTNFGSAVTWGVGRNPPALIFRTFIRFDISALAPEKIEIISATLRIRTMTVTAPSGGDEDATITRVTGAWTEGVITWNLQPTVTTTGQISFNLTGGGVPFDFDLNVTTLMQDAVDDRSSVLDLRLKKDDETTDGFMSFASFEDPDDGDKPELIVVWRLKSTAGVVTADPSRSPAIGDGSESTPYNWDQLKFGGFTDGDTLSLIESPLADITGTVIDARINVRSAGSSRIELNGAFEDLAGLAWTDEAGDRWSLATPDTIEAVAYDYRELKDGMFIGHLKPVASTAAVEATAGSYFHDGALLHVHLPGGADPNDAAPPLTVGRTITEPLLTILASGSGSTFTGINFRNWFSTTAADSVLVQLGETLAVMDDLTFTNCDFFDVGNVGTCMNGLTLGTITNLTLINCRMGGMFRGIFIGTASDKAQFMDLQCLHHLTLPLLSDEDPSDPTTGTITAISFGTINTLLDDIDVRSINDRHSFSYDGSFGVFMDSGGGAGGIAPDPPPGDEEVFEQYPIRIHRGTIECYSIFTDCPVARRPCTIDGRRCVNDIGPAFPLEDMGGNGLLFADMNLIIGDTNPNNTVDGFMVAQAGGGGADNTFHLKDCIIMDLQTDVLKASIDQQESDSFVIATASAFVRLNSVGKLITGSPLTDPLTQIDWNNCVIDGFNTDDYHQDAAINTQAEWISNGINDGAFADYDPGLTFINPPIDNTPTNYLRKTRIKPIPTSHHEDSLNHYRYSGHIGCYQWPASAGTLSNYGQNPAATTKP